MMVNLLLGITLLICSCYLAWSSLNHDSWTIPAIKIVCGACCSFVGLWLIVSPAFAQQSAVPNPQEQIERTLGNLFITNTQLNAQLQSAQAEIIRLKAELAEKSKAADPPKK